MKLPSVFLPRAEEKQVSLSKYKEKAREKMVTLKPQSPVYSIYWLHLQQSKGQKGKSGILKDCLESYSLRNTVSRVMKLCPTPQVTQEMHLKIRFVWLIRLVKITPTGNIQWLLNCTETNVFLYYLQESYIIYRNLICYI